jgi:DNA-binding response OmpR family regulator
MPVMFVTGYADVAALRQVDGDQVVQKPFQEAELAAKVRHTLRSAYGGDGEHRTGDRVDRRRAERA